MCKEIRWRNNTESVNENVVVVPPGSNILCFPFREAPHSYSSSKHCNFHLVCFLLCDISWLCVVSFGVKPKQQFLALIPLLLSAGPLCLSVATSMIMPHCVLQSSREQRNPDLWQYAQTLSPQGAPRDFYSKFFFSLLPFFLSPHVSHIFCSLIYYFCYCSNLDLIKVDFLPSVKVFFAKASIIITLAHFEGQRFQQNHDPNCLSS